MDKYGDGIWCGGFGDEEPVPLVLFGDEDETACNKDVCDCRELLPSVAVLRLDSWSLSKCGGGSSRSGIVSILRCGVSQLFVLSLVFWSPPPTPPLLLLLLLLLLRVIKLLKLLKLIKLLLLRFFSFVVGF